jgi:hypothetical protein
VELAARINYGNFSSVVSKHSTYKILRLVICHVVRNATYKMLET